MIYCHLNKLRIVKCGLESNELAILDHILNLKQCLLNHEKNGLSNMYA